MEYTTACIRSEPIMVIAPSVSRKPIGRKGREEEAVKGVRRVMGESCLFVLDVMISVMG